MLPRLLCALATCLFASACGDSPAPGRPAAPEEPKPELPVELQAGKWSKPQHERTPVLSPEQASQIDALEAIGYADGVRPARELTSVTIHDRARAQQGYNFYTSGHGTEAFLIDMQGRVLHTWHHDYEELWPEAKVSPDASGRSRWRRAMLLPGGDVLAIHERIGMIRLDLNSRLLWQYPGKTHHDLDVLADGTIWTLARKGKLMPHLHPSLPCLDDFLVELSPQGEERRRISILACLEKGKVGELLEHMPRHGELFHTNSIEMLDGRAAARVPAFAAGNLLISLRTLNAIAVVDPKQEQVVWWMRGDFIAQHDPTVLDGGTLLLFDNRGRGEASTIHELDPATGELLWSYRGTPVEPFYSETCGSSYRLANGNTLINESDGGRSFEVTRDGTIVWEFFNPHRGGPNLEYIACLYDLVRVDPASVADWLPAAKSR